MKIKIKNIFLLLWFFLLLSRIILLTTNYPLPINPVSLEVIYVFLVGILLLFSFKDNLNLENIKNYSRISIVVFCLFIHILGWGVVFINNQFSDLIYSRFKSQIMFFIIVVINILAVVKFKNIKDFIKVSFYALSLVLIVQFFLNISDVNLENISNIMSKDERTRSNFGMSHYNALGGLCLCNIILYIISRDEKKINYFGIISIIISAIMLLCSASRSSLTGLAVFFLMLLNQKYINNSDNSKRKFFKFSRFVIIIGLIIFALNLNFNDLLKESQRNLIFEHALPTFFNSGRTLIGLGYASNTDYGTNLTPYRTYWLDNGYIYILVTTGIIGALLIFVPLLLMFNTFRKSNNKYIDTYIFSILCTYLYTSIFEVGLFESGSISNYIYLIIFIYYLNKEENIQNFKEENK